MSKMFYHRIKISFRVTGREDDDGIHLAQERLQWRTLENIVKDKHVLVLN
jgi:hypothetical protein